MKLRSGNGLTDLGALPAGCLRFDNLLRAEKEREKEYETTREYRYYGSFCFLGPSLHKVLVGHKYRRT